MRTTRGFGAEKVINQDSLLSNGHGDSSTSSSLSFDDLSIEITLGGCVKVVAIWLEEVQIRQEFAKT
jgi:hypothetical protein